MDDSVSCWKCQKRQVCQKFQVYKDPTKYWFDYTLADHEVAEQTIARMLAWHCRYYKECPQT